MPLRGMLSEFRDERVRRSAQSTANTWIVPGISLIALATPWVTRLTEQPLDRIAPQALARLGNTRGQRVA